MAYEPHIIDQLMRFTAGADLLPGDPVLATVTKLQRAGLLSAKPIDMPAGPRVRVRLASAGYAAIEAAPRRTPREDRG